MDVEQEEEEQGGVARVKLGGVDEAVPDQVAKVQATWKEQVPQHTLQPAF